MLFWLTVVAVAAVGAIILTISNWNRFISNPTVVSIQKDYRNWENTFPAATGCFDTKVNLLKAEKFIQDNWGVLPANSKYNYYLNFIKAIANATYFSLDKFVEFKNDSSLNHVNMAEAAVKVHPTLSGTLVTVDTRIKRDWELVLTELGVCFLFNSKIASILTTKNILTQTTTNNSYETLSCHFLNGLCYARYDSDPTLSVRYHIHSYLEVAHITSKQAHKVEQSEEMEINYKMVETFSSPNIKYLAPTQRRCRFEDEPLTKDTSIYSTSMCYMFCRYKMSLQFCGCKPFFYHFLGGKVCDVNGLICLSKFSKELTSGKKNGCDCPQPCNSITYLAQIPKYTKWEEGGYFDQRITFRWGLLHPTTKYKRDIIFGFGDLIGSLGGTVNLFLGISFISLIEAVYLLCESILKKWA